ALGSDTGGSVRIPASFCGVTGIKPTYGRVSRAGCTALAWSLDHVGVLARSAEDAAVVLAVLAGHDPADPTSAHLPVPDYVAGLGRPLAGVRIGVPRPEMLSPGDPAPATARDKALADLRAPRAVVSRLSPPPLTHAHAP